MGVVVEPLLWIGDADLGEEVDHPPPDSLGIAKAIGMAGGDVEQLTPDLTSWG